MNLEKILKERCNKSIRNCTDQELYYALLEMTKHMAQEKVSSKGKRKLYYISAEFLIGKLLSNNLINLGIYDDVKQLLEENGKNLSEIEELEPEPPLSSPALRRNWNRSRLWETAVWDGLQHVFWIPLQRLA